jgi:G:T-mismatch repair DNA endonuclease (very short patch repair protein)
MLTPYERKKKRLFYEAHKNEIIETYRELENGEATAQALSKQWGVRVPPTSIHGLLRIWKVERRHGRPRGLKYNWTSGGKTNSLAALQKGRGWNRGIRKTPEQNTKTSLAVRKAATEGRCKYRTSTLEKRILEVLERHFPGEWAHVGDGKVTIEGYAPDFINTNGKKIVIEAFGLYWHKPEDAKRRTDLFAKYGYRTLIIWEASSAAKRLPPEEEIVRQVKEFMK